MSHLLDRFQLHYGTMFGVENTWTLAYRFHPVGQGMLHSGELRHGRRPPFTWVYDCGSLTALSLVTSELDNLCAARGAPAGVKPKLDFVALSHFDKDHISGLVYLLGLFEVKTILLPFVPLWQRFWIAASADDLDTDFLVFLVDPVGYLLGVDGGAEATIVFVPPSEGDAPPAPDAAPPEGPLGEADDRTMTLRMKTEPVPDVVDGEIPDVTGKRFSEAKFLKKDSVLDIDGLWEFVPYNDADQVTRCSAHFLTGVTRLVTSLLAATNQATRKVAFDSLKAHYDGAFGKSAFNRNIISLFLYGGPVPTPTNACFETGKSELGHMACCLKPVWCDLSKTHFSMLFTGDGSLDTARRRTAFATFFTPYGRLDKASVFQVMHHGARGNSSPQVPALVAPRASIFCSDPTRGKKHPAAEVLRDFWIYNPIQVDNATGWQMLAGFTF